MEYWAGKMQSLELQMQTYSRDKGENLDSKEKEEKKQTIRYYSK